MQSQKGVAHLFLLLVVFVVIIVIGYLLISKKKQLTLNPQSAKESVVQLKTDYKNPFDKKDQYVNPFDTYKSPLNNLK